MYNGNAGRASERDFLYAENALTPIVICSEDDRIIYKNPAVMKCGFPRVGAVITNYLDDKYTDDYKAFKQRESGNEFVKIYLKSGKVYDGIVYKRAEDNGGTIWLFSPLFSKCADIAATGKLRAAVGKLVNKLRTDCIPKNQMETRSLVERLQTIDNVNISGFSYSQMRIDDMIYVLKRSISDILGDKCTVAFINNCQGGSSAQKIENPVVFMTALLYAVSTFASRKNTFIKVICRPYAGRIVFECEFLGKMLIDKKRVKLSYIGKDRNIDFEIFDKVCEAFDFEFAIYPLFFGAAADMCITISAIPKCLPRLHSKGDEEFEGEALPCQSDGNDEKNQEKDNGEDKGKAGREYHVMAVKPENEAKYEIFRIILDTLGDDKPNVPYHDNDEK